MSLRDDVLIQSDAISPTELRLLMEAVHTAQMSDSLVSNFDEHVDAEWVVNKAIRDTQEVALTEDLRRRLADIDTANIRKYIEPFFAVRTRDREPSLILHYGPGGHYIPHVDAETLYTDDDGVELWEKTLDRDLSLVYFLNDDFEGGELVFPTFELVIRPQAGTLVCFPSDHHFIHGVKPVTAGRRYTIVTWLRVQGMPALEDINQYWLDEYHRQRPQQIEQPPRLGRGRGVPNIGSCASYRGPCGAWRRPS